MKKKKEKRERIVRKKGFAKIGIFILGLFLGIIVALGSLVGVGFWAYKNLTLNKIEKITNSSLGIDNQTIKKMSLEDVVANITKISQKKDTYTIENIEEDFGLTIIGSDGLISDEFYGLDLSSLKQSTISSIPDDIQDIISNANINLFLSYLEQSDEDLGIFANILNSKITFYYDQTTEKLYEDEQKNDEVSFDYTVENGTIKLISNKDVSYEIKNNKIEVQFRYVALNTAFSSFNSVTDNLQLYEVLGYYYDANTNSYYEDKNYTTKLTGILKTLAPKTIEEISSATFFDNLKLYEVFGYYYDGTTYYNEYDGKNYYSPAILTGIEKALAQKSISTLTDNGAFDDVYIYDVLNLYEYDGEYYEDENHTTKATGVLNAIAGKTIAELSDDKTYNDIYIYEVMNYTRSGTSPNYTYKDKNGNTVDGVLGAIAGSTVGNLSNSIEDVTLGEALKLDDSATGVLNVLKDTKIKELKTKINDLTLGEALELDGTETGILKTLSGTKITALQQRINDLTLGEALSINKSDATGAILSFYDTPISNLSNELNPENLFIYKAMGYTYDKDTGKYYNGTTEVTGVMATMAGYKLNKVEDAIDAIKVKDVLPNTSPILGLFTSDELQTLTIETMSEEVVDKINEATVGELIDCGLISVEGTVNNIVRSMTIKQLIAAATTNS